MRSRSRLAAESRFLVDDRGALLEGGERLQPDVIVLDLNNPTVNGLQACRQITKANPDITVILPTAESDSAIMHAALAAGASAFIEKQTIVEDLLSAITRMRRACCRVTGRRRDRLRYTPQTATVFVSHETEMCV